MVDDDSFDDIIPKNNNNRTNQFLFIIIFFSNKIMIKQIHRSIPKVFFSSLATEPISSNEIYVPPYEKPLSNEITKLQEFISNSKRLFILTGAGISTESGIPDYRSEGVGLYARTTNRPM